MPPAAPEAWLTLPANADELGPLRARYLRRTLRLLLELPGTRALLPNLLRARSLVGTLVGGPQAGAVYAALSLPQVGGPLHAVEVTHDAEAALLVVWPNLLAELARRRAIGREGLFWDAPIHELLVPAAGVRRHFAPVLSGAWFRDGEVDLGPVGRLDLATRADSDFVPLAAGGWLALADNNPLAMNEAHPDKDGNRLSLGGRDVGAWLDALNGARALIQDALPDLAREHQALLATVVPVGYHPERSLSASFQEVIGLCYVSLHPDRYTLAEALIHETQHNKLNLLARVDPVLEAGADTLVSSPVRPDLRPLWGVLLAVHAFLPVAEMYHVLLTRAAGLSAVQQARYRAVLALNHEGMETLRAAEYRASAAGQRLLTEMDRLERLQAARACG